MSITAITSALTIQIMGSAQKQFFQTRSLITRLDIARQIHTALLTGNSVLDSIASEQNLSNCVTGAVVDGCVGEVSAEFELLDGGGGLRLGGTTADPAMFRVDGTPCALGSNCIFQSVTSYIAHCPVSDPTPCTTAQSFDLSFTLSRRGIATGPDMALRDLKGTISRQTESINMQAVTCPSGKYLLGLNPDGSLNCEP